MVSTPAKPVVEPLARLEEIAQSPNGFPMLLRFPDEMPLSDRLLEQISRLNKPWQFERTAEGELVIMAPSGIDADEICLELGSQLRNWVRGGIGGRVYGIERGIRARRWSHRRAGCGLDQSAATGFDVGRATAADLSADLSRLCD